TVGERAKLIDRGVRWCSMRTRAMREADRNHESGRGAGGRCGGLVCLVVAVSARRRGHPAGGRGRRRGPLQRSLYRRLERGHRRSRVRPVRPVRHGVRRGRLLAGGPRVCPAGRRTVRRDRWRVRAGGRALDDLARRGGGRGGWVRGWPRATRRAGGRDRGLALLRRSWPRALVSVAGVPVALLTPAA